MPAVVKNRSKHVQTPYTRKKKHVKQSDDEVTLQEAKATGIIENATKGLFRLMSWVFNQGEDISKNVGVSASKIVHREQPKRSLTSQLEDGTLNGAATRSESMLAPDLVPHYLGKTPKIVRKRREEITASDDHNTGFQIPSFDASQFKIPALPTPPPGKTLPPKNVLNEAQPRGRSIKSLEINAETQSRHDEETLKWLSSQNLTPEALTSRESTDNVQVDDYDKLHRILRDAGFFRRRGLFPPVLAATDRTLLRVEDEGHKGSSFDSCERQPSEPRRDRKSPVQHGSDYSSNTKRGKKLAAKNWQTSSGILSAWRDMCQLSEASLQNESLRLDKSRKDKRAEIVRNPSEPMLWREGVTFSQKSQADPLESVPELNMNTIEAGEKYWAPIRSFPMPQDSETRDSDVRSVASSSKLNTRQRQRHSRLPSIARRPQQPTEKTQVQSPRESRHHTPISAVASVPSVSRRPVNASRGTSRTRQTSLEPEQSKPDMVSIHVQTTDELMSFLAEEPDAPMPSPSIPKDRRKRAGVFSALDDDMVDLFGPYSDVPLKRTKLDDEDDLIARPRIPLLRESDEVKKLRAQHMEEIASATPADVRKPFGNDPAQSGQNHQSSDLKNKESNDQPSGSTELKAPSGVSFSLGPKTISDAPSDPAQSSAAPPMFQFGKDQGLQSTGVTPVVGSSSSVPTFDFGHDDSASKATSSGFSGFKTATKEEQTKDSFKSSKFGASKGFDFGSGIKSTKTDSPQFSFGKAKDISLPETTDQQTTPNPAKPNNMSLIVPEAASTQAISAISTDTTAPKFSFGKSTAPSTSTQFSFGPKQDTGFNFKGSEPEVSADATKLNEASNSANAVPISSLGSVQPSIKPVGEPEMTTATTFDIGKTASKEVGSSTTGNSDMTFSFGSKNTANTSESRPTFSFGASQLQQNQSDGKPGSIPLVETASGFRTRETSAAPTFAFGLTNSKQESIQSPSSFTNGGSASSGGFNFGTEPKGLPTTDAGKPIGDSASQTPVFKFGTPVAQPEKTGGFAFVQSVQTKPESSTPVFGNPSSVTQAAESIDQPTAKVSTPVFGGASKVPVFGSTNNSTNISFGENSQTSTSVPVNNAVNNGFAFSNPPAVNAFGATSAKPAQNAFFSTQSTQNTAQVFGTAPSTTGPFAFGNTAAPTSTFAGFGAPSNNMSGNNGATSTGFGAPSINTSGNNGPTSTGFGFGQTQAPAAPAANLSFQFGGQTAPQTFAFGQAQAGSGLASPAIQSPSIQSATAPGSPNPFNFDAAQGSNATGTRKIAQPRSRRPRAGR